MDKRVLLAFLVSMIMLGVYWSFFPPSRSQNNYSGEVESQNNQTETKVAGNNSDSTQQAASQTKPLPQNLDDIKLADAKTILIETETYKISFNTLGAVLDKLELKNHKHEIENKEILYKKLWRFITGSKSVKAKVDDSKLVNMVDDHSKKTLAVTNFTIDNNLSNTIYQASDVVSQNGKKIISFSSEPVKDVRVVKRYEFEEKDYQFKLVISVTNNSDAPFLITPKLRLGSGNQIIESSYNPTPKVVMSIVDGDYDKHKDVETAFSIDNFNWLAISDVYFVTGVLPGKKNWVGSFTPVEDYIKDKKVYEPDLSLSTESLVLNPKETWQEDFKIYMGAKDVGQLKKFDESFTETLDLFFNIIARPMIYTLRWFYDIVKNWGVAIMLLTVSVRLIIFPIAFKGMQSMKRMSKLGPKMKAVRKKYANDKQKLNKEVMQLYRKNKINPVSGCLPLIMQIPIFIALYWALLPAVEIRHQPFFLWISDLSHSDPYMILPFLMGLTMYIQQKISPSPAGLDPMQVKIMRILPVFMTLLFVNFPAGLVLYWVTSNVISIGQQLIFNRIKTKELVE